MKSWKTTLTGIVAVLSALVNAAQLILDNNPATNPDWVITISAISAGLGLIFARDNGVSSADLGLKSSPPRPPTRLPGALPLLLTFGSALFLTGCGSAGHVATGYDPVTGALVGSAGVDVDGTNVTIDVSGSYNPATGQPGPLLLTVTFRATPTAGVVSILSDAGAVLVTPRVYDLTLPSLRDPNSPQFAALRAALAEGATINRHVAPLPKPRPKRA